MSLIFQSVPAMLILIGTLWCLDVIRKIPDDLMAYRESTVRAERIRQIVWWTITGLVGVVTIALVFFMWGQTAAEWESWKRSF